MVDATSASVVTQTAQRLRWVSWSRIGILGLLGVTTASVFSDAPQAPTPLTLLASCAALVLLSAVSLVALRSSTLVNLAGGLQILGDLALGSVVVYLTGGAESAFSVLFHLSVIVAGFLYGSRGGWLTALGAVALYTTVAISIHTGFIASPGDLSDVPSLETHELINDLVINITSLIIVSSLTGYLAERERLAGGKLAEVTRASADLAALNEDIVRSLTIGLAATDTTGTVLWLNPAGSEILGTSLREPGAPPLSSLVDLAALTEGGAPEGETTWSRPDGRKLTIAYRVAPLLDSQRVSRGWLVVFQDTTSLRRMQEQVERAERLAALGRLAAGLAHEMRNPLGSISGSLEIIRDGANLDDDERRLIKINLTELGRLADLVTQMLELARPRPPRRSILDLSQLVSDIVEALRTSAEVEEIAFHLDLPPELETLADPGQMRQLVWNLLRNAVQASPAGSVVRVRAAPSAGSIVLEIEDEGTGIASDEVERVFEPFFSTKRGGIGMGLAICKQVVVGHGGTISVRRREPHGSTFRVELPTMLDGETRGAAAPGS